MEGEELRADKETGGEGIRSKWRGGVGRGVERGEREEGLGEGVEGGEEGGMRRWKEERREGLERRE